MYSERTKKENTQKHTLGVDQKRKYTKTYTRSGPKKKIHKNIHSEWTKEENTQIFVCFCKNIHSEWTKEENTQIFVWFCRNIRSEWTKEENTQIFVCFCKRSEWKKNF